MQNKYNKIMDKIQVSQEMKSHLLRHLAQEHIEKPLLKFKKLGALAACLMIAVVGLRLNEHHLAPQDPGIVQEQNNIIDYSSVDELAQNMPFVLEVPDKLPQGYQVSGCSDVFGIAQVVYLDGENEITYRMGKAEDVSGDYNLYGESQKVTRNGINYTLKGEKGKYCLVTWQQGQYRYSLSVTRAVEKDVLMEIAESVKVYK